jgi:hypothetical protein
MEAFEIEASNVNCSALHGIPEVLTPGRSKPEIYLPEVHSNET